MDCEVALRLQKMKAERNMWFHWETSRFLFFSFPEKIFNVIQSFSFQLYEIIIDYLFKVNWSNLKTIG